jgi:hypothetical protein
MPPEQSTSHHHHEISVEEAQHNDHEVAVTTRKNPLEYDVDRSVWFSTYDEVFDTLDLDSYSSEERQAVWCTREELYRMQLEQQEEYRMLENHEFFEDEGHTARGLETFEERCHREELTCQAIDCVLEEQASQFNDGIDDQEYIAMLYEYFCITHQCSRTACKRAARDHE